MAAAGTANGLAWDFNNNRLFLRDGPGNGGGNLYTYDLLTNTQRLVTPSGAALAGTSLAGNAAFFGGNYWFVGLNSDTLTKVSFNFTVPTAPTYTFTNYTNFDGTATSSFFAADIHISVTGQIYGGGDSTHPAFRINLGAGMAPNSATYVNLGTTTTNPSILNNQLAQSSLDDKLYGIAFSTTTINRINPTTGVAAQTNVGTVTLAAGHAGSITDMAGRPLLIPEPASLALLLPALPAGVLVLRRRRKA